MREFNLPLPDAVIARMVELALPRLREELAGRLAASPYLTVLEAAERLRAKPQRVYDLLSAGRLTRFKDGSRVLVSCSELDEYLAGNGPSRVAPALPHPPQTRINRDIAA